MNPGEVIPIESFCPSRIAMTKITVNKGGKGRSAYLNYGGKKFSLAFLDTRFPFGASPKMKDEGSTDTRDQWVLQIEPTPEQIKILEDFDQHVIDYCLQNEDMCSQLLGESYLKNKGKTEMLRSLLENKYISVVKYSKDKVTKERTDQYPPKIRCSIPIRKIDGKDTDEFTTQFFQPDPEDPDKSIPLAIDNLPDSENHIGSRLKGESNGRVLMSMSFWATASGFGVTMRALQIRTQPRLSIGNGQCFLDGMMGSAPSTAPVPTQGLPEHVDDPELLEDPSQEEEVDDQFEEALEEEELVEEELVEEEVIEETPVAVPVAAPKPAAKTVRRVAARKPAV